MANIIKSGNTLENPSENNVSVLTLEAGTKANTFALKNSGGYLYAASSDSNYLKVQNSIDDNASWSITISNTAATIKSNGTNTRNTIKYNPNTNNNNPLFSCYNNGQEDVVIYVKNTTILDPSIPFLTVTPGKHDTKIPAAGQTLTFTVMTNQAEWAVTSDNANFAVTKADDGFTVTVSKNTDAADRNATITVTAGELTKPIALTQSGVVSVKKYTLTINTNGFNSDSYAANNKEHTTAAVAEDGSKLDITWQSNQVMLQSKAMQWQKNTGAIYNVTDLGEIISVTVNKTSEKSGTFTTYYGTSQKPTKDTTVGGGYFQTKVGSDNTGKTSSIVIVFNK